MRRVELCCALLFLATGCASERTVHERGWLGGRYADVANGPEWISAPWHGTSAIRGLPNGVTQDGAALVVGAWPGTPAAKAGLAPGDLVLAVDGTSVESAQDLRDAFLARAPGTPATVSFWRAGQVLTTQVATGCERWTRQRTLTVGIPLSPTVDLWPFDDGIDVFGLVAARTRRRTPDLAGPEAAYLRQVQPGDEPQDVGRGFDVHLLVVGTGSREQVLSQE